MLLLARRRCDDVDAAEVRALAIDGVDLGQTHEGLAAAKELGEGSGEVFIDDFVGLVELDARDVVDLLDGCLGILDRVKEVFALCLEEGMAL